jgi:hypothetical protein
LPPNLSRADYEIQIPNIISRRASEQVIFQLPKEVVGIISSQETLRLNPDSHRLTLPDVQRKGGRNFIHGLTAGHGWNDLYSVSVFEFCQQSLARPNITFIHENVHVPPKASGLVDNEGA